MRKIVALLICVAMLITLGACKDISEETTTEYVRVAQIDYYAVEADDRLTLTDDDIKNYSKLVDAVFGRKESIRLENSEKNVLYTELFRQSPYGFFVSEFKVDGNKIELSYSFSEQEQQIMIEFMDRELLSIINSDAQETDNELDIILKIYSAVCRKLAYDYDREDNKQLDSPLFVYPQDEVYKALKTEKSLCYGFAYIFRFAMMQVGIDCFCEYGQCTNRDEAHMWNIFKYNGEFYTCDSAWDRADDGYVKLLNFGKTDNERVSDGLKVVADSIDKNSGYEKFECNSEDFLMFRGIERYTYVSLHSYYMEDFHNKGYTYHSDTNKLEEK